MALVLRTPGVYVKEVSLFPPSVAQVETAVPAFIGYTEQAFRRGADLSDTPTRIDSLPEFEALFGGAPEAAVTRVDLDVDNVVTGSTLARTYLMYDALRLFFANGGSKCWIVSVGRYPAPIAEADLLRGLDAVAREDEPTLLLMPDSVQLESNAHYNLQVQMLAQCAALQDRFGIFDLLRRNDGDELSHDQAVAEFRNRILLQNLRYGAAYTPWLRTNLPKTVSFRQVRGQLFKVGNPVALATLTANADIQAQIARLSNAIDDVDRLVDPPAGAVPQFVANLAGGANDAAGGFRLRFDAFRTTLAGLRAAAGPTINDVRNAYATLFDYVYRYADAAIDDVARVANPTFTQIGAGDPAGTSYVADNARTRISDVLRGQLRTLNQYSIGADARIGAGGNNLFIFAGPNAPAFEAAEWTADEGGNPVDIFGVDGGGAPVLPALAGAELDAVYPTNPAPLPGDQREGARADNMENAADRVARIFARVDEEVGALVQHAHSLEESYHASTVNAFPLLRDILTRSANSITEMPPSGAIAGIYSAVDGSRGVHKAPANIGLANVETLVEHINAAEQGGLNIDSTAGKSINAIRNFTGRGILVWGARTLDGNSNEWRYVNVRRFFNMVEESTKKASERFVFEANDKNTWVKVQGMIQNFLLLQWRNGALQGATPEQAFFVKVGLGQTMTALDVLEGRMIIEIGMAVVRPAEFIILRFSHKMPEA